MPSPSVPGFVTDPPPIPGLGVAQVSLAIETPRTTSGGTETTLREIRSVPPGLGHDQLVFPGVGFRFRQVVRAEVEGRIIRPAIDVCVEYVRSTTSGRVDGGLPADRVNVAALHGDGSRDRFHLAGEPGGNRVKNRPIPPIGSRQARPSRRKPGSWPRGRDRGLRRRRLDGREAVVNHGARIIRARRRLPRPASRSFTNRPPRPPRSPPHQ